MIEFYGLKERWEPTIENNFPDLRGASVISIDLETNDKGIQDSRGCGAFRGEGHIAGIAITADFLDLHQQYERISLYYPIGHDLGFNFDKQTVLNYCREQFGTDVEKVGANLIYDLSWLCVYGVEVKGKKNDIQIAQPLLDEEFEGGYSLNNLAKHYLGMEKFEDVLKEACEKFGVKDIKADMWKMPAEYVGAYAIMDTLLTLDVFIKQKPLIEEQGLQEVYDLETEITDVVLAMVKQGVRVDVAKAEELNDFYVKKEKGLSDQIKHVVGKEINVWAQESLSSCFEALDLPIEFTEKGNPSFTKQNMKLMEHPVVALIMEQRNISKLRRDFIEGVALDFNVNGRIHPEMKQMKQEFGGTRSGRFSYANPNLQQIPARDEELAPLIRGLFIPEDGVQWHKFDYSQQEPRIAVHYANILGLDGVKEFVDMYTENPEADIYPMMMEMAGIDRTTAKAMFLGKTYGMGVQKMADKLGIEPQEAKEIITLFDKKVPFLRALSKKAQNKAESHSSGGVVKTILGRQRHFNFWEPNRRWYPGIEKDRVKAYRYTEALKEYPNQPLKRANAYRALNAIIQGSAADMTKKAMVMIHRAKLPLPCLQVHDELDNANITSSKERYEIKEIMENAIKLSIPIVVDSTVGPNWGQQMV